MNSEELLITELIQTGRMCRSLKAELLLKHGLYAGQDRLLKSLEQRDGQSMSELAKSLNVRPPTVTKMVSRMSGQGLIEKKTSDSDSRSSNVFITSNGLSMLKAINKAWKKAEKTALKNVKSKRQKKLLKCFRQINSNLLQRREEVKTLN